MGTQNRCACSIDLNFLMPRSPTLVSSSDNSALLLAYCDV